MVEQKDLSQFSEAHYQIAMEAAGIGMWAWDLRQNRQTWSKECKTILGVPQDIEENYSSFLSLLHPQDRRWVPHALEETKQKRTPHSIVYRIFWPDGSMHWIADRGRFLYDEEGQAMQLIGVVMDVTSQKQAEAAFRATNRQLEEQQAFSQAILQQAPAGIIIAEAPSGKLIGHNEEALRILRVPDMVCDKLADYTRFPVTHLDGTPYLAEEFQLVRAISNREIVKEEEALYRFEDGSLIPFVASAAPIYDAEGRLLAGVLAIHDISERYALEQQKDEFICLASHELRTPLTSLKGNLQLIQRCLYRNLNDQTDRVLTPEESALFEQLLCWCERALRQVGVEERLVNDLLDAASLRSEELRVILATRDVGQVVSQALDDLQTVAPPRLLMLETSVLPELLARLDAVRIGQVLTNYVMNALPYASDQRPVTVGIDRTEDQARVWVQDSGPGLSEEQQQTVWKRFCPTPGFSGYRGMTCGGLGLGFYICERLIHLHGGSTGVDSAPGHGSRFWFQLPLLEI